MRDAFRAELVGNCAAALTIRNEKFAYVKMAVNRRDGDKEETSWVTLVWLGEKSVEWAKKMNIEKGSRLYVRGDGRVRISEKDGKQYVNVEIAVREADRVYSAPKAAPATGNDLDGYPD